jgi:uncharacterized protein YbjT (DUF2867 family)
MNDRNATLILGGTGKTGSRVARQLTERGHAVRIGSRSGVPPFDWERPDTWRSVLDGVSSVYLAYYPDIAAPGAAEHISDFSTFAVEHGVRRIVLLSGRGEPQVQPSEQAVRDSGAEFTILECAWFCQNFSEGHLLPSVLAGQIALPAGNVAEPFIDAEDIAEVAVAALTTDAHLGKTYDLTGPGLHTFAEAAAELARASGRPVRYLAVTPEEYADTLRGLVPPEFVAFLTDLFQHVLDGHNAFVSSDFERAMGKKPRSFTSYARAAAASGAWRG